MIWVALSMCLHRFFVMKPVRTALIFFVLVPHS